MLPPQEFSRGNTLWLPGTPLWVWGPLCFYQSVLGLSCPYTFASAVLLLPARPTSSALAAQAYPKLPLS